MVAAGVVGDRWPVVRWHDTLPRITTFRHLSVDDKISSPLLFPLLVVSHITPGTTFMRSSRSGLLTLLVGCSLLAAPAGAQLVTQTQTLDITVSAVDVFTITNPAVTATVGVGAASFSGGTYAVQTNSSVARVLKGQLTTGGDFPVGLALTVTLAGTGSTGAVTPLTASATDLVTGITNRDVTGQAITFNTNATVAVPAGALLQRTITYTFQ